MIIALVDKLDDNLVTGVTLNFDKFIYNLQLLGGAYYNDFQKKLNEGNNDEHVDIIPFGRYLCVIQQASDKNKSGMVFADTFNVLGNALILANVLLKDENGVNLREMFMEAFSRLQPNYQDNYFQVELSLDASVLS